MWVIGVIMYIFFSGEMFFLDENWIRMYNVIMKVKYFYNGEVSKRLLGFSLLNLFFLFDFGDFCCIWFCLMCYGN